MSDLAKTKALAWPAKRLGDLFRINGDQVAPMASPKAEFVHYSIPAWDATGGPAIEIGSQIESNKTVVSGRAVLVSKLNPRKPRTVAVLNPAERTCCSTEFICYQPKQPTEDPGFWAAYFASNDFSARLARVAVGSTNSHTRASPKETLKWLVPEVSSVEQHKIVQVLGTLDIAIHETEAIIAKLKALKQGLLHDLLTRGIDANGELRPPKSEAPHLYKQSQLGWIPKAWEVCRVLDVAPVDRQCILTGPFGADLGQADFRTDGVPVLRIGNVQSGFIDWGDTQHVTPQKASSLGKYRVQEGDLLFARQGATTGRNALADARAEGALINYHIIRVAVDKVKCHPTYLFAAFNSETAKSQVDKAKGRGTREGINSEQIASFLFALPEPAEQTESVARMLSIDVSTSSESRMLKKLRLQKSGLMDDLITGRVRVTPLLEASVQ